MEFQEDEFTLLDIWKIIALRKVSILTSALVAAVATFVVLSAPPKVSKMKLLVALPTGEKPLISFYEAQGIVNMLEVDLTKASSENASENAVRERIVGIEAESISEAARYFNLIIRAKGDSLDVDGVINFVINKLNEKKSVQDLEQAEIKKVTDKVVEMKKIISRYDATMDKSWKSMSSWRQIAFNPLEMDETIGELKLLLIEEEENLARVKKFVLKGEPLISDEMPLRKAIIFSFIAGIFGFFVAFFFSFAQAIERKKRG